MNVNITKKINIKNFLTGIKKIFNFISPILAYFIFSSTAFAANCNMSNIADFKSLVTNIISCFLTPIEILIVSTAVIIFVFKVFTFIRSEGDEKKQAGREFIVWGIIGLFVMVSLWGIVRIFQSTLQI